MEAISTNTSRRCRNGNTRNLGMSECNQVSSSNQQPTSIIIIVIIQSPDR
uniref:Uncharacterized protein n=1 Tax=Arion vulgaris TaxID=1028688 RepID=A0A0B7A658_9EUPU